MIDLANPPDQLSLEPEAAKENEIITVYVKGQQFFVTPTDALSIMNQISGVLLAHGYSRGREPGQKKYTHGV